MLTTDGPILKRFLPILTLTAICWVVFVANNVLGHGQLTQYGIIPRRLSGLPGIIFAPFLHVSFRHLAANTGPMLVLGAIICARGKGEFVLVTGIGILLGGGLSWLLARNAVHVGASGLIFCYFGYLASLAWFNRSVMTVLLSIACLIGYGGMIRGILPTSAAVSWEGHLAGLISGIVLAWFIARVKNEPLGPPTSASPPSQAG